MSRDPHIAIDISTLDGLVGPGGQARYVIDLVNGLSELERSATFVVLGSRPEPLPAISQLFAERPQQWSYQQLRPLQLRAANLLEPMRRGWVCRRARVDVFHTSHAHIPLFAGCPIVVTLYDLINRKFKNSFPGALRPKSGIVRQARRGGAASCRRGRIFDGREAHALCAGRAPCPGGRQISGG